MTDVSPRPPVIRFGVFEADLGSGELRKRGLKVKLQHQPFQILALLLEHRGEIVSREELQSKLWGEDTFVDFDHSVATAVKKLRGALGDTADDPRFIETVPRQGYRFVAPTEAVIGPRGAVREPPLRRRWVIAVAGSALAVAAVLIVLNVTGLRDRLLGPAPATEIQSIAVLPLMNLSSDPEQEYFADGMTHALIAELGRTSNLRVISFQSMLRFRGTKKSVPEIARELNVSAVVEGAVLRSGGRVRITAQLIQARPERHLWTESYEDDSRDVLALQSQVARAIAGNIELAVKHAEQTTLASARPVNPEAHEAYLKGRYFFNHPTREDLLKATKYLERAIQMDPEYAPAYALLSGCYFESSRSRRGDLPDRDAARKTKEAATKALNMDDSLAEAHTWLGVFYEVHDWDWTAAEREFKRAIEADPNLARAHAGYAYHLMFVGRRDEAIQEAALAAQLNPISVMSNDAMAMMHYYARQNDQAIEWAHRWIELFPDSPKPHRVLAWAFEAKGMDDEAVAARQKCMTLRGDKAEDVAAVGEAYKAGGIRGVREWRLERLKERASREEVLPETLARLCSLLGKKDEAFEWLEKAYEQRMHGVVFIRAHPHYDNLRSDPHFDDLLRRMNFPP